MRRHLLVLLAVSAVACGDPATPLDAEDAGGPVDAGLETDGGASPSDAGAEGGDAGAVPDAGDEADAGHEADAGMESDAGDGERDGGSEADAGEEPDAGTVEVDAGIEPDAGADPDAGVQLGGPMVAVPGGPFLMGSNNHDADEKPQRTVTLTDFEIDVHEVTQAEYAVCVAAIGCTVPSANYDPVGTPNLPVVNVTWQQALDYCNYVGKRLPTEAEWEKAARGTDGRTYPWGNAAATCALANIAGCGPNGTNQVKPVGTHPDGASPYGALDMAGNVFEWVADYYDASYYASAPTQDPPGPDTGTYRVYRGGSSGNAASLARTSNRSSTYSPTVGGSGLGFRCAR